METVPMKFIDIFNNSLSNNWTANDHSLKLKDII